MNIECFAGLLGAEERRPGLLADLRERASAPPDGQFLCVAYSNTHAVEMVASDDPLMLCFLHNMYVHEDPSEEHIIAALPEKLMLLTSLMPKRVVSPIHDAEQPPAKEHHHTDTTTAPLFLPRCVVGPLCPGGTARTDTGLAEAVGRAARDHDLPQALAEAGTHMRAWASEHNIPYTDYPVLPPPLMTPTGVRANLIKFRIARAAHTNTAQEPPL